MFKCLYFSCIIDCHSSWPTSTKKQKRGVIRIVAMTISKKKKDWTKIK